MVTPIPECVCAQEGRVTDELLGFLDQHGYDQAPVETAESPIELRLTTRATLQGLREKSEDLGSTTDHYETDDLALASHPHLPLLELLSIFESRRAAIVYHEHSWDSGLPEPGWEVPRTKWKETQVFGLLTISDLNNREVRKTAYELLLDLETQLALLTRRRFIHDSNEWVALLGEQSQVRILGNWTLARRNGVDTNPVEYAMVNELLAVATETESLRTILGFTSKTAAHSAARKIGELRNRVMHPVRPFVLGTDDVKLLHGAVEAADMMQAKIKAVAEA